MQLTISSGRKEFISTFLLVVVYAAGFYALQFFLFKATFVPRVPEPSNLYNWDANWYWSIVSGGYEYNPKFGSNAGFFMLFPLVWKVAHVGARGMCILNILFFATGFSLLCRMLRLDMQNKILWLSVPTVYFAFIPYSEALFFLLATIALYGIKTKRRRVIWISLFLLSLTRSTAIFLAPAFLLMSLTENDRKDWNKSLYSFVADYMAPMLAGLAVFVLVQFWKTGVWFAYFKQQSDNWARKFNPPVLPFGSITGPSTLWLAALAMFIGFFCFLFLVWRLLRWLQKNEVQDNLLIASCGYLFMALLVIVFYNPTWATNTTNVSGAFRYTFMNPFFYVFLYHFTNNISYSWKSYLSMFLLTIAVWFAFGSYKHILFFLYFLTNTIIIFLFMLHANKKLTWPAMILTAFNIFFQVELFQQFISPIFPD